MDLPALGCSRQLLQPQQHKLTNIPYPLFQFFTNFPLNVLFPRVILVSAYYKNKLHASRDPSYLKA